MVAAALARAHRPAEALRRAREEDPAVWKQGSFRPAELAGVRPPDHAAAAEGPIERAV